MKRFLFGLWLVVLGLLSSAAQAAESPVEAVLRIDAARQQAMMAGHSTVPPKG